MWRIGGRRGGVAQTLTEAHFLLRYFSPSSPRFLIIFSRSSVAEFMVWSTWTLTAGPVLNISGWRGPRRTLWAWSITRDAPVLVLLSVVLSRSWY